MKDTCHEAQVVSFLSKAVSFLDQVVAFRGRAVPCPTRTASYFAKEGSYPLGVEA